MKPGSRRIPVELRREITERDGGCCTFVDEHGNRCTAREHLTIEHRDPHAKLGPTSPENLCLLCMAHNLHAARKVFGEAHVEKRILEACNMGFREAEVRKALASLKKTSRATGMKDLIVEALAMLVPPPLTVRDTSRPRWRTSATIVWPGPEMTIRSPVPRCEPPSGLSFG